VLPAAVLFATTFTVGPMGRYSEITAAKAGGISFLRLIRPLLLLSGAAVVAGLVLGEAAPGASSKKAELLGLKQIRSRDYRPNFVYRADGGWVYVIGGLEVRPRTMREVVLEREGAGADYPTIVIAAQQARYSDSTRRWRLLRGQLRYLLGAGQELAFAFDSLVPRHLVERPEDLLAEPKAPDEMRYAELGRYIDALARSGSDTKKLVVERALKIAIPFTCLVIALFGAPLAMTNPRSGAAWGLAVSLATTFVFLLLVQLSKAVGAGGVVEAVVDVTAEDGVGAVLRAGFQEPRRAAEIVERPVAPPAAPGRRVMREHQLAARGIRRIGQGPPQLLQLPPGDAAMRDDGPCQLAHGVHGDDRELIAEGAWGHRRAFGEIPLVQFVGGGTERIAVVVARDADEPREDGRERLPGEGEFLLVGELGEIAGEDAVVGAQCVGVAGDELELLRRVVVVAAPAFPQLDAGERAQGAQLAEAALPPAGQLHVRIGEMEQPQNHLRSSPRGARPRRGGRGRPAHPPS